METHFKKNRALNFLFQCLSLSSPLARIFIFCLGISVLTFVDINSLRLPNICLWERFLGYCPAHGTTRALNAFFRGEWEEAIRYNLNILVIIPIISGILVVDVFRLIKQKIKNTHNSDK